MRLLVPLAIALHALAGCSGPPGHIERAITHGTDDNGDLAVAALLDATGAPFCTGTLITPEAVLTAAHCLVGEPPVNVYFGATPGQGGETIPVGGVRAHPAYDPGTQHHDVGIVLLAASPAIEPARVYARPFDRSFIDKPIRLVGFGRAAMLDGDAPRKRSGSTRIRSYTDHDFFFAAAPSQTCFGDSGGPAFVEVGGIEHVVGVTSTGDLECRAGGTDERLDVVAVAFVETFLSGEGMAVQGGCSATGKARGGLLFPAAMILALLLFGRRRFVR